MFKENLKVIQLSKLFILNNSFFWLIFLGITVLHSLRKVNFKEYSSEVFLWKLYCVAPFDSLLTPLKSHRKPNQIFCPSCLPWRYFGGNKMHDMALI